LPELSILMRVYYRPVMPAVVGNAMVIVPEVASARFVESGSVKL
jgi:hypothetical protein